MKALMADYGQQAGVLHKRVGEDVFVASYQLGETQRGELFSYSVWTEGVPTSLPVTDKVFLHSERWTENDPRRGLRDWSVVEKLAARLMEKEDFIPPRVRVREFPADDVIAQMGSAGT